MGRTPPWEEGGERGWGGGEKMCEDTNKKKTVVRGLLEFASTPCFPPSLRGEGGGHSWRRWSWMQRRRVWRRSSPGYKSPHWWRVPTPPRTCSPG
jgi:hypothetical protein